MSTDVAKRAYQRRKQLAEPVFGIIKEQMGVRRFLLRGLVERGGGMNRAGHGLQPQNPLVSRFTSLPGCHLPAMIS